MAAAGGAARDEEAWGDRETDEAAVEAGGSPAAARSGRSSREIPASRKPRLAWGVSLAEVISAATEGVVWSIQSLAPRSLGPSSGPGPAARPLGADDWGGEGWTDFGPFLPHTLTVRFSNQRHQGL